MCVWNKCVLRERKRRQKEEKVGGFKLFDWRQLVNLNTCVCLFERISLRQLANVFLFFWPPPAGVWFACKRLVMTIMWCWDTLQVALTLCDLCSLCSSSNNNNNLTCYTWSLNNFFRVNMRERQDARTWTWTLCPMCDALRVHVKSTCFIDCVCVFVGGEEETTWVVVSPQANIRFAP